MNEAITQGQNPFTITGHTFRAIAPRLTVSGIVECLGPGWRWEQVPGMDKYRFIQEMGFSGKPAERYITTTKTVLERYGLTPQSFNELIGGEWAPRRPEWNEPWSEDGVWFERHKPIEAENRTTLPAFRNIGEMVDVMMPDVLASDSSPQPVPVATRDGYYATIYLPPAFFSLESESERDAWLEKAVHGAAEALREAVIHKTRAEYEVELAAFKEQVPLT